MSAAVAVEPYDALEAVGLDELVEEAGLLARVDRKYLIPHAEVGRLIPALPTGTRVLEIEGSRAFGYSSTYLDTADHLSYLSSGRGHRGRWKVRTRSYLDTGSRWLEIKTHGPRGQTLKQRIEHPAEELTAEGCAFVEQVVPAARRLRPVLTTAYRRATLLLPASPAGPASRLTVDIDLAWSAPDSGHRLVRPLTAIVETKTGATPSAADRLLWAHGHRPVSISKFGVGLAAFHPELPRLKWHRVLTHLGLPRAY